MNLSEKSRNHVRKLCVEISDRSVGSKGNRLATQYVDREFKKLGLTTSQPEFDVMDWQKEGADLICGNQKFEVFVGPYSRGCDVCGPLYCASTLEELEKTDATGGILFVYGDIAKEQLMPKNFVFYNPEEHQHLVYLLEHSQASAIISATGRNGLLTGGEYPFPLIEDGDFDIPNVFMTEEEGRALLKYLGMEVRLISRSRRIPSKACNNIAKIGTGEASKIVITAHIDAKKGSPGAIDNATGVTVLLLLAELLQDYAGKYPIELVAFNGEDYYAASGQMNYIASRQGNFKDVLVNINIDGAGYYEGVSVFSLFGLTEDQQQLVHKIFAENADIEAGIPWVQGDHSIFVQFGRPAIAVTSKWMLENLETQSVTHTAKDNISIVNPDQLVSIALAIEKFVKGLI
ncbi:MAG: M28 family peptidase [Candidatus Marinimicrobia bacterium]|nr:M28 family peptidase [Candidatus Neomarinimicrobiota bacterium]